MLQTAGFARALRSRSMTRRSFRVAACCAIASVLAGCGVYDLGELRERAADDWSKVEIAYRDRSALAGELSGILEASGEADPAALTRLGDARAAADNTLVAPADLDKADAVATYANAQTELASAIEEVLDLSADQAIFRGNEDAAVVIQNLGSSQSAIMIATDAYNASVQTYNAARIEFPNKIWADHVYSEDQNLIALETTAGEITIPEIDFSPVPPPAPGPEADDGSAVDAAPDTGDQPASN